jgi:hypothetical protein
MSGYNERMALDVTGLIAVIVAAFGFSALLSRVLASEKGHWRFTMIDLLLLVAVVAGVMGIFGRAVQREEEQRAAQAESMIGGAWYDRAE